MRHHPLAEAGEPSLGGQPPDGRPLNARPLGNRPPGGRPFGALSIAALLLAVPSAPTPRAQETASDSLLTVGHYLDWETVADPQISPDGTQVVYTRRWVNKLEDKWESALWIVDADGTKNRSLVKGANARWSPDGTRIVYLAEGEPAGPQIFVRWMDSAGAVSQITHVTQKPTSLHWAPDGRSIAFAMRLPAKDTWKIDLPAAPEGAKWTKPPRLIEHMHFRQDRQGFVEEGYTHLFVVAADGGTPRQLTEGEWNVGDPYGLAGDVGFDWTPDGGTIVFEGLRDPDADLRYRESHLFAVDVRTGALRQITNRKGPWSNPVVSPGGRLVAFTGYDWTPQTYKAEELYVVGLDGTRMRQISGDFDRDPESLNWAADGQGVYFAANDRGTRNVYYAAVGGATGNRAGGAGGGAVRQVTQGNHMLSLASVAANGTAVGLRSSYLQPEDVVLFKLPRPREVTPLTHVNDDVLSGLRLGRVEEIRYASSGGARVQGWIVEPPGFDRGRKYPLLLSIHGGPHSMYGVGFNYSFQNFAANDYVVLYTNPRGSTGYGTAFGNAIDDDYPSVDYDDLMAGADSLLARGWVDPAQLYVTGQSGGGVLSSWIIGHNQRFAAAAVRAPVIDWISFAGNTDITSWGYYRFQGRPWENPDKWLKHSPLMYVANVKTPTLLMTGELDLRTPIGQSEEYYQALKTLGVPTRLLRFYEEYHGTGSKPANFMRTQLYIMSWFEKYGPQATGAKR